MFFSSFRNKKESVEELFQSLKKTKRSTNGNHEIDCFFIEKTNIELKARETTQFEVQFIATTNKRREALLVFMNEAIGEFLFLLEGVPKKPEYVQKKKNKKVHCHRPSFCLF